MGDLGRELALALASDTLWTALLVGAPVLVLSMFVGLLISIFQVVTQIQEASLSFVPKIAKSFVAPIRSSRPRRGTSAFTGPGRC